MYFNSDLNRMVYSGDVTAATITGGTINIGGGNFTVDGNGNMYANNGTLKGTIESSIINGSTINTGTIIGGTVSGAVITSSGSYGTTTISGGNIVANASGDYANCFSMNSGDFNARLQPVGMLFTKNQNNTVTQALSMYPWQITIIDYNSTLGGTKHTDITPESITTYMGTIEYCDGSGTAIPNVSWVQNNLISQSTPTSSSTATDKVPSYAACAKMITNIKDLIPSTSNFVTTSDLSNYATKSYVTSQDYVTGTRLDARVELIKNWVSNNFQSK